MNPTFSFIGISSITIIWAITTIGLPPQCWTHLVVPCLSIFCLCDHKKLWKVAEIELNRPYRGVSIGVALLPLLYWGLIPWKLLILMCSILCLMRAFSFEKMLYMGGVCGELAKSMCWRVAATWLNELCQMRWKGDWAYCSPYSRKLIQKDLDYYYTLKPESHEARTPESFLLDFPIEDCRIVCKYFESERSGDNSQSQGGTLTEEEEEEAGFPLDFPFESDKKSESTSSSNTPDATKTVGNTSAQQEILIEDQYVYSRKEVNKLELSLSMLNGEIELESYTFFQRYPDGVAEIKRAMEVLKDEGNLIFSSFYRNMGARSLQAHARCYELEEICALILDRGYRLVKVNLKGTYACCISGSALMSIFHVVLILWIQYYQVNSLPPGSLVSMLILFGLSQLASEFMVLDGKMRYTRKVLFLLISRMATQDRVDQVYQYFLAQVPCLTFCNESYGYPVIVTSEQRSVCCFPAMPLPVKDVRNELLQLELPVSRVLRKFDLRTLDLQLKIIDDSGDGELQVSVLMHRKYDALICYHNIFRVSNERKVANLVAVLNWLENNSWIGICKEWPLKSLMHAYSYEELCCKILQEGAEPWIIHWPQPFDISMEGPSDL